MLNVELEQYELKIQHYEHLYEQELATFQSEIYRAESSYQIYHLNELMDFVKIYVHHHTKLLLHQIRYKESYFRVKLLRHHQRYRSQSRSNTIDVYPQIIVDVSKVTLNQNQLDYLSRTGQLHFLQNSSSIVEFCITYSVNTILTYSGPNYIRANQSCLHSHQHRGRQVKQEHENVMNTIRAYLVRVYHMPPTAIIINRLLTFH
jgi:hypothetical protein